MTCWRRLRDWQRAGVWDLIHFALLDWLARNDQIDWSRAVVDSCSIRAVSLLAMRLTEHGGGLGLRRWVAERTFAWLSQFRRLRVRYDKRTDIHEAFLSLRCKRLGGQYAA